MKHNQVETALKDTQQAFERDQRVNPAAPLTDQQDASQRLREQQQAELNRISVQRP